MSYVPKCPYCGGNAEIITTPYDGDYKIMCSRCGLQTNWCRTKEEAVAEWCKQPFVERREFL